MSAAVVFGPGFATSAATLMGKCRTNELRLVGGRKGQLTGACEPGFSAEWQSCVQICRALRFWTGSVGQLQQGSSLKPAWLTAQM